MNLALSAFYSQKDGIVIGTDETKYGFRMNSDVVRGKFKLGESLSYNQWKATPEYNTGFPGMFQVMNIEPLVFVYDEHNNGGFGGAVPGMDMSDAANPVAFSKLVRQSNSSDYLSASGYIQFEPIRNLVLKFNASRSIYWGKSRTFVPTYEVGILKLNTQASLGENRSKNIQDLYELTANWEKTFKESHHVQALLGASQEEHKYESIYASGKKCHTFNWDQPIDDTGLRARDMGFNWMQMWEWDYRHHLSLDRTTLGEFVDGKLAGAEREAAIDALVESNKVNRAAFAGVAICFEGFGVWDQIIFRRPGEGGKYDFETDERIRREIASISADPDQLVRMWYFSDEAGGNFHRPLKRAAQYYAAYDKAGYPAFNLGNLPAVMAGDVGGNDIYLRYYGGLGSAAQFADRVDDMRREYAPLHRRPFIVPQAFGQSERQSTETPEWVRVEAYLSCIGGANGIGFYCWTQTGDWNGSQKQGMGWNPATAHEVQKLIAEIKVFQGALMSGSEVRALSNDGNVRALYCGDDASGRYLICANTFEGPVDTEIAVPGLGKRELEPLFGAPKPSRSGETLRLKLPQIPGDPAGKLDPVGLRRGIHPLLRQSRREEAQAQQQGQQERQGLLSDVPHIVNLLLCIEEI